MPKQNRKGAWTELVLQFFIIYALYGLVNMAWSGLNSVAMAGSNQVKMVQMRIGVLVLDGDNHPICPSNGVHLVLNELGDPWPPGVTATISGHPDPVTGQLVDKTAFPVHPTFIRHLSQAYEQAPSGSR